MPTPTRRNRPAHEVRAQILDAAAALFAERAPAAVTLREIAERAGVQHSLIIRHFESKDGLIRAVVAQTAADYAASVMLAHDPADGFVRALDHLLANRVSAAAFATARLTDPAPQDLQASYPGAAMHRALLEAAAGPASRDPRVVAAAGACFVAGWAMLEEWALAAFDLETVPVDEVRREVADMLRDLVADNADL